MNEISYQKNGTFPDTGALACNRRMWRDTPKAAESDQRELLNNASTLTVTGDLDDIVLDSDLTADGTVAGRIVEQRNLQHQVTITSGGEPWFYIAFIQKKNGL